jgi:hypothetical protein
LAISAVVASAAGFASLGMGLLERDELGVGTNGSSSLGDGQHADLRSFAGMDAGAVDCGPLMIERLTDTCAKHVHAFETCIDGLAHAKAPGW